MQHVNHRLPHVCFQLFSLSLLSIEERFFCNATMSMKWKICVVLFAFYPILHSIRKIMEKLCSRRFYKKKEVYEEEKD